MNAISYTCIQLYALMVASMVENVLHQGYAHVLLGGLVMTAGKVRSTKYDWILDNCFKSYNYKCEIEIRYTSKSHEALCAQFSINYA